jgi:hypothetical protein
MFYNILKYLATTKIMCYFVVWKYKIHFKERKSMNYKDYKGCFKTYVVVHNTGFGTMEANFVEHDVVYETDDYGDATSKALEFKIQNNTPSEIQSSWCNNTYHVNVNTLSEQGNVLFERFSQICKDRIKTFDSGLVTKTVYNGISFYITKMDGF